VLVGVGRDEARIDSKAVAANQTLSGQRSTTASNRRRRMSLSLKRPWRLREKVE
jgi:hypothetical protein